MILRYIYLFDSLCLIAAAVLRKYSSPSTIFREMYKKKKASVQSSTTADFISSFYFSYDLVKETQHSPGLSLFLFYTSVFLNSDVLLQKKRL